MSKPPAFGCQFEFTPDNRAVIIALVGKLDPEAVEELHPQVQEVFHAGLRRFVFDLSDLEHAGSLGLRLFLGLQNQVKGQGRVTLCSPSPELKSLLEMTKLTRVIPLYPTRDAALEATNI
ncbi:STAS domain-containing protein [Frigoriglobus tundricola]|uniref:Anti-sigma factor antagonist n=1 Tax=Frigoriglobus tundricola TaxID=2774151 RepID=A0A6M5YHB1_9BACT|nr:STAS domain-containing protein [Frigoriglobus tundricola]QJW93449.1 hypothetical protein FTUN_0955 [Frigoriglobus tundricola]